MNPVFHDPKYAQETIEKLNNIIRELKDKISKEKAKPKARWNGDASLEVLDMRLKLTQQAAQEKAAIISWKVAQEKAATLEVVIKEIIELQGKLEAVGDFSIPFQRSEKRQRELEETKEQLEESNKKIEGLKQGILQATMSKDALEARNAHMECVIKDLEGKLNAVGVAFIPPDVGGVNTAGVFKRPPTVIPTPRNHPKITLKKFERADSDVPEIRKFKPSQDFGRNLSKISSSDTIPHKVFIYLLHKFTRDISPCIQLEDSHAFQIFWKRLGIFIKAIPSRRKLLSPVWRPGDASWTKIYLKQELDKLYQPFGFAPKFIFLLDGLLRWGPDKINALAFVPLSIIQDGVWTRNDEFANVDGDTIEVFFLGAYNDSFGVCYAGTYKCYHAHNYFPEGVCKPRDIIECSKQSSKSLSKLTVAYNNEDALQNYARLSGKYGRGELKADCAILECVGFDEGLYEKLSELSESSPTTNAPKRKSSSSEDLGSAKRVRI
ncbi:hypothetical protein J132_02605 [Termitomyces sp. J132]|nr:hypothetical protein J132_02605 [Termitomyces sp. J132]